VPRRSVQDARLESMELEGLHLVATRVSPAWF
jgi:hypothetical protein